MSEHPTIMTISEPDMFKKHAVGRTPATSILTSLLTSPKTTCSSPDPSSPSDGFSETELSSRTGTPSPPPRIPSRKCCVSFAAAQPRIAAQTNTDRGPAKEPVAPPKVSDVVRAKRRSAIENWPMLGSVFDGYWEDKSSPVFLDSYRSGQPKKLVDDCLKKEKELRIPSVQDDEKDDVSINYPSDVEEEDGEDADDDPDDDPDDEDDDGGDDDNGYDEDDEGNTKNETVENLRLKIDSLPRRICLSPAVYTPSKDVVDNFVPGTLDEDQVERFNYSPTSLHDIDPTYPSDNEDECVQDSATCPLPLSPVRFIPKRKAPEPHPIKSPKLGANGLGRTNSLPWGHKRYSSPKKHGKQKNSEPRCAAIAITKMVEHKRPYRRDKEKKQHEEQKGVGVEALAAMAKQLGSKSKVGLWSVSV